MILLRGQQVKITEEIRQGKTYWVSDTVKVLVVNVHPNSAVAECSSPDDTSETIRIRKDKLFVKRLRLARPYTHKLIINERMEVEIQAIY